MLVKMETRKKLLTYIGLELAMTKDSTDFAELIMYRWGTICNSHIRNLWSSLTRVLLSNFLQIPHSY